MSQCTGKEGSAGCQDQTSSNSAQPATSNDNNPAKWILYILGLWTVLLLIIAVIRTCSNRNRRQKFLNRTVNPVLVKMGIRKNTAPSPNAEGGLAMSRDPGMNISQDPSGPVELPPRRPAMISQISLPEGALEELLNRRRNSLAHMSSNGPLVDILYIAGCPGSPQMTPSFFLPLQYIGPFGYPPPSYETVVAGGFVTVSQREQCPESNQNAGRDDENAALHDDITPRAHQPVLTRYASETDSARGDYDTVTLA